QKFEIKNYTEFNEQFFKVISMFSMLFIFIVIVISLVVLFTTINTLTMSVMERIAEIGSLRAMGVRRSGIRRQFLVEGVVIGISGATLGIISSIIITYFFNNAGFSWTPPSNASSTPLKILLYANPLLLIGTWLLMVFVATVSSLIPARFAAKMNIVDAIRHG
ncbi:MAG TPA: ABC transporter permease, partial [Thiotrichaceae bacterium]|nr:ABC transporter permease [Thiotrichaceae bacterium]